MGGVKFEELELGWSKCTKVSAKQPIGKDDTKNKNLLERK